MNPFFFAELDALALETEEEVPSYLSDLNNVPDFVDEPPVELGEVSSIHCPLTCSLKPSRCRHQSDRKPSNKLARCLLTLRHWHLQHVVLVI
jgi:hypothetical protein